MEGSQIAENKYLRYFFYLVLMELFLMGSGQELHVTGFLTLRMVNFLVAVAISVYFFIRTDDFPKTILWLLMIFTMLSLFSYFIAYLQGTNMGYVIEDIKPLIYFYILLFFYYMSSSEKVIRRAFDILLLAGKIMTILYLIYIILTDITGIVSYVAAYQTLETDSFMFRGIGSAIFYKGFIFLPIAAVGFLKEKKYVWLILTSIAIYYTYTRGLYLLLVVGLLAYYLKTHHVDIIKIVAFVLVVFLFYDESFKENREESDFIRLLIIQQVFDAVTYWSVIMGHGFGYSIGERTTHMEISYLDIFHKQGLLGIFFWVMLLYVLLYYGKLVSEKYKETADFWVTAALMIYLQSFFNPYINTPMGMSVVLLALVFCYRLSQDEHFTNNSPVQC
jgi:hypothetical protein